MENTTQSEYKCTIQTSKNGISGELNLPLNKGTTLFVLGANGVGKSALTHRIYEHNSEHSKRILSHRQIWFTDNSANMTPTQKIHYENQFKDSDRQSHSRTKDEHSNTRPSMAVFDLINFENVRARKISNAVDKKNMEEATGLSNNIKSPLAEINELFAVSNIPVHIEFRDEQLFASKNGSELYSIAELSDGEKNTLLICADVLTAEENSLIIIDEPERHLHRSIIAPLLSSLLQKRKDCAFVISTHDIDLPVEHPKSNILLLRGCQWNGRSIKDWDADLISEGDEIPDSIKREILGSKRNILFVEGTRGSLDMQLYQLIFSNFTVIPQGNCSQVINAVAGIKATKKLNWINAYGLIDNDGKTDEDIQKLSEKGIAVLPCYSVESLYYNPAIVEKIAQGLEKARGQEIKELFDELFEKATSEIVGSDKLQKKLFSKICEKQLRARVMSRLPKNQDILKGENFHFCEDTKKLLEEEKVIFDKMVKEKDYTGIINRYPVRETSVLNKIVKELGLLDHKTYGNSVRELIRDDKEIMEFYKDLLSSLIELIAPQNENTRA